MGDVTPSASLIPRIATVIPESEIVRLLVELIETPSYTGLPQQELAIASRIRDLFRKEGIEVHLQDVYPGRPNVIGILDGGLPGPTIVYDAHLDTIPPLDPAMLVAQVRDGRVAGLGAVDDKGPACAMIMALVGLRRLKSRFPGKVMFVGVADEEIKNRGTAKFVEARNPVDFAILGEATALDVAVAHKGIEWLEIDVTGKAVHSSRPQHGINAIAKTVTLINQLQQRLAPRLANRTHPMLGSSLLNLGVIQGGTQPNQIAPQCRLQIERRYNPGETLEQIYQEIETIFEECRAADPDMHVVLRKADYSKGTNKGPLQTDPGHPYVGGMLASLERIGVPARIIGVPYCTDAPLLADADVPVVIFAPGNMSEGHSRNESIAISDLVTGTHAYAALVMDLGMEAKSGRPAHAG